MFYLAFIKLHVYIHIYRYDLKIKIYCLHFFFKLNIPQSVQKLYRRSNEVMSDFRSLSRNVKSQLFSTFCLDVFGSQIWPF